MLTVDGYAVEVFGVLFFGCFFDEPALEWTVLVWRVAVAGLTHALITATTEAIRVYGLTLE